MESFELNGQEWRVHNPDGDARVVVTHLMPGQRWLEYLLNAGCRVEVRKGNGRLPREDILAAIGEQCDGVIGQMAEKWGDELFSAMARAGVLGYSNFAVGYDNIDLPAAIRHGIPVGNTPGVLTKTTAELALALTLAAARKVVNSDKFVRAGHFGKKPVAEFFGTRLNGKTVGVIGAGQIGGAYARMMVRGFGMNLVYFNRSVNEWLEEEMAAYAEFVSSRGEDPISCRRAESVEELLAEADVVCTFPYMSPETHHLINARRMALMKPDAILINASRGPVVDEAALVEHCRANPGFRAGLDVYEDEPALKPGLAELDNVTLIPHMGSATIWTREAMATLAGANVAGLVRGYPVWSRIDMRPFTRGEFVRAVPSVVNGRDLGLEYLP